MNISRSIAVWKFPSNFICLIISVFQRIAGKYNQSPSIKLEKIFLFWKTVNFFILGRRVLLTMSGMVFTTSPDLLITSTSSPMTAISGIDKLTWSKSTKGFSRKMSSEPQICVKIPVLSSIDLLKFPPIQFIHFLRNRRIYSVFLSLLCC